MSMVPRVEFSDDTTFCFLQEDQQIVLHGIRVSILHVSNKNLYNNHTHYYVPTIYNIATGFQPGEHCCKHIFYRAIE